MARDYSRNFARRRRHKINRFDLLLEFDPATARSARVGSATEVAEEEGFVSAKIKKAVKN